MTAKTNGEEAELRLQDGCRRYGEGTTDWPVYELANLPDGDRFTVLYWDWFPSINTSRGVKSNFGIMIFIALVLLLGGVNYAFLSWRVLGWRNGLAAGGQA